MLEKDLVSTAPTDFVLGSRRLATSASTSGTTGTPITLWRSFSSVAVEQAAIDRLVSRAGVDPSRARGAVLRGDDVKSPGDREPPYWVVAGGGRRLIFSSNHLSVETLHAFADALEVFAPAVLHAYPTILESLCLLLRDAGRRLRIPVTMCSSETLSHAAWNLAEEMLETRVIDYYGLAERVAFAYANEPGAYRFLCGYSYTELHRRETDGETELFEIIATGLWNLKMPLVRFRTGDLVRLRRHDDTSAVAHGVAPFYEVVGRTGDYLVAPDGARLMGIDHIPRGVSNVIRIQVVQEQPDIVRILVVPNEAFDAEDERAILRNAALKLPPTMDVSVEMVTDLERTAAQKAPFVIRRYEGKVVQ